MKAVFLNGYGDVDQLSYGDAPDPKPAPGEVLVKVLGTSLNPVDWKIRKGYLKEIMPVQFPFILGRDAAGEVVALGEGVTNLKIGNKVMGLVDKSYAELLTAKADTLAKVPDRLNIETAAVMPVVTLTGTQLIEKGVQAKAGQTVLVTGALGGVGRTAVYIARAHGCRVIAGVKASQRDEVRLLNADQVVVLDNEHDITAMEELDAIADAVGGETLQRLLPKLKKSGVVASVVGQPEGAEKYGVRAVAVNVQPDAKRLGELAEDVREVDFSIPISRRFKLSEIREATAFAEQGGSGGKVLLTP